MCAGGERRSKISEEGSARVMEASKSKKAFFAAGEEPSRLGCVAPTQVKLTRTPKQAHTPKQ